MRDNELGLSEPEINRLASMPRQDFSKLYEKAEARYEDMRCTLVKKYPSHHFIMDAVDGNYVVVPKHVPNKPRTKDERTSDWHYYRAFVAEFGETPKCMGYRQMYSRDITPRPA